MSVHIKHRIRDGSIWLLTLLGISALHRARTRRRGPLVRVIAFHHIKDVEWFERTIAFLVRDFHVLTPEEFHLRAFDLERINVLITFDDGYASWVSRALPVLEKYGVTAIFFIISGLLNKAKDQAARQAFFKERLCIVPKPALTWEGAAMLVAHGHTIGGHTVTHARLSTLSAADIEKEIHENKHALESQLGVPLTDFAYPFGRHSDYSEESRNSATKAGYTHCYSAESGFFVDEATDIPRTLIERGQSTASIGRWIRGGYDVFALLNMFK